MGKDFPMAGAFAYKPPVPDPGVVPTVKVVPAVPGGQSDAEPKSDQ